MTAAATAAAAAMAGVWSPGAPDLGFGLICSALADCAWSSTQHAKQHAAHTTHAAQRQDNTCCVCTVRNASVVGLSATLQHRFSPHTPFPPCLSAQRRRRRLRLWVSAANSYGRQRGSQRLFPAVLCVGRAWRARVPLPSRSARCPAPQTAAPAGAATTGTPAAAAAAATTGAARARRCSPRPLRAARHTACWDPAAWRGAPPPLPHPKPCLAHAVPTHPLTNRRAGPARPPVPPRPPGAAATRAATSGTPTTAAEGAAATTGARFWRLGGAPGLHGARGGLVFAWRLEACPGCSLVCATTPPPPLPKLAPAAARPAMAAAVAAATARRRAAAAAAATGPSAARARTRRPAPTPMPARRAAEPGAVAARRTNPLRARPCVLPLTALARRGGCRATIPRLGCASEGGRW
jgi:hypothetical protein